MPNSHASPGSRSPLTAASTRRRRSEGAVADAASNADGEACLATARRGRRRRLRRRRRARGRDAGAEEARPASRVPLSRPAGLHQGTLHCHVPGWADRDAGRSRGRRRRAFRRTMVVAHAVHTILRGHDARAHPSSALPGRDCPGLAGFLRVQPEPAASPAGRHRRGRQDQPAGRTPPRVTCGDDSGAFGGRRGRHQWRRGRRGLGAVATAEAPTRRTQRRGGRGRRRRAGGRPDRCLGRWRGRRGRATPRRVDE